MRKKSDLRSYAEGFCQGISEDLDGGGAEGENNK